MEGKQCERKRRKAVIIKYIKKEEGRKGKTEEINEGFGKGRKEQRKN